VNLDAYILEYIPGRAVAYGIIFATFLGAIIITAILAYAAVRFVRAVDRKRP